MNAMKIGLVDLDTSHPENFIPIIRRLGHEVIGVYDGGTIYPAGYANQFAAKHTIPNVYTSLEDMAEQVDAAIIHSCNWDLHLERAKPFIDAGKPILIDKPIAGNMRDILTLLEWERKGARIAGGSSLRFCQELKTYSEQYAAEQILFAHAGCSVDEFNYGIHAYSLLCTMMGSGIKQVRYLGSHAQHQVELVWNDHRRGLLSIGQTDGYLPMHITTISQQKVIHLQIEQSMLYSSYLESHMSFLTGGESAPICLQQLVEPELAAIAMLRSRQEGGAFIQLADLCMDDAGYNGALFASEYKLLKLPVISR